MARIHLSNSSRISAAIAAIFVVVSLAGCHSLDEYKLLDHCDNETIVQTAYVDVGGHVLSPGSQIISPEGISLRRLIARAGGFRLPADRASGPLLVGIQSGEGLRTTTTFFPANMVETGMAGAVLVNPGALVQVTPGDATGLNGSDYVANQDFAVHGMVANAGRYRTSSEITRVSNLLRLVPEPGSVPSWPDVVVVTRRYHNGVGVERYVLPLEPLWVNASAKKRMPSGATEFTNTVQEEEESSAGTESAPPVSPRLVQSRGNSNATLAEDSVVGQLVPAEANPVSERESPIAAEDASNALSASSVDALWWDTYVLPGDELYFTRIELVPQVFDGLIRPAVSERVRRHFDAACEGPLRHSLSGRETSGHELLNSGKAGRPRASAALAGRAGGCMAGACPTVTDPSLGTGVVATGDRGIIVLNRD